MWSPDGQRIAFASSRDPAGGTFGQHNLAAGNLYERRVGAVGDDTFLLKTDVGKIPTDWSRDGYLAYTSSNDVWALPLPVSSDRPPVQVTATRYVESNARVSPNGRWIAYQSTESATGQDVWIQSFPDGGVRHQVSASGGTIPRWGRDGRELFYIAPDRTLMSASITPVGTNLDVGTPTSLFHSPAFEGNADYDVSRDGRFLLKVPISEQMPSAIAVILNWASGG